MFTKQYNRQKSQAACRDISFNISYEEWVEWWGEDIHQRGRGMGKLQMCRIKDQGPYELGNIFKSTHEQNMKDKIINGTHKARPKAADEAVVNKVKELLEYCSTRSIAAMFNISQRTVCRIKNKQASYG